MVIEAVIEMETGTNYKYEINKYTGMLTLDRVLKHIIPTNYGFIPETLCEDGDNLDIFVLSTKPLIPGSSVKATIIGGLICRDNGQSDDKLIAVLEGEQISPKQYDLCLESIKAYLQSYKEGFIIDATINMGQAIRVLEESKITFYASGDEDDGLFQ